MHRITLDGDALMRQAGMTAEHYFIDAREMLEKHGVDPARRTELIIAFMQAAAIDMAGTIIAQQVREGLDRVATAIDNLHDSLRSDHPQDETLQGIASVLEEIAEAVGKRR